MPVSPGTNLGPYEILSPLGSGGMGEVYRARDSKLKRDVAVKVLPPSLAKDPDALARFEREALAVAALSHPNILSIFDFGTQDGTTYAVMELLEGETLRGKLDSGRIAQKQAVDYAVQIARGLSAAHGKGVVHRDLKPENVFVSRDGHVKILDFGLAKRMDKTAADELTSAPTNSGQTGPGTVMGTMGYMSPEQVRGLPVDHRTDIFSFGAMLYELLSGAKAFKRNTASDTIAAILKEEPPELSQSGAHISPGLDHIVRHCLEKDREDRFQAAKDIAFALSEASDASSSAIAAVTGEHFVAPPRRKGRVLVAVAALAVVLAAVGYVVLRRGRGAAGPGQEKRLAVLPFENLGAPEDDYFADGIADAVRGKLTSIPGIQVIARASSTPYKKTKKTPSQIGEELKTGYLLTATVRWEKSGGKSHVLVTPELVDVSVPDSPTSKWQQPFDAALTNVFGVQSEIASKVADALGVVLGASAEKGLAERPTSNVAAYDSFLKGEQETMAMAVGDPGRLRKGLGHYEAAVALDPAFAQGWAKVSVASSLLYSNGIPAPELAERARGAAEKAIGLAPMRWEGYHALGNYHRLVAHDMGLAREQYAKGLRIAPTEVALLGSSASAEEAIGLWDSALEHAKQAVRMDPRNAAAFRRLGEIFLLTRRYPEARENLDRALALSPQNMNNIEYRAMTFLGQGDLAGARASLKASSSSVDPAALVAYMANFRDLAWVLDDEQRELLLRLSASAFDDDAAAWGICLAQAYATKHDAENVRVHAETARKAFEEQVRKNPNDDQRHALLGLALAYLGRKDEAIKEGLRALELMPLSKDASTATYNQHQLARIYTLVGEPEKALDQLEPLLRMPYFLSPAWLRIDPNFEALRKNPRFQKLTGGST
jgi:TolB-like protein/tetratricopeptide (TPR) repeat protein